MYVYLKNKKHVYVFICVYVHLRAISQGLDYEGHWTVAYQRKWNHVCEPSASSDSSMRWQTRPASITMPVSHASRCTTFSGGVDRVKS